MGKLGDDLTNIALVLIGVAFVGLLIGHASQTAQLISAGTGGFNTLLTTVESAGGASGTLGGAGGSNPVQELTGGVSSSGGLSSAINSLGGF